MNRRHFLITTAATTSLAALGTRAATNAPDELVRNLIRANDARIPGLLAKQERRAGHRWLGGLPNEHGLYTAQSASGFIVALTCAACAPGGKYHHATELAEPLRLAVRYLLAAQYDDGTVDLNSTNFRSPPDTAFILEVMCPAYALLRASPAPEFAAVAM